ncbi:MAG: alpha-ketoglutarate-dependent dioxygenase AlkB, partial [Bacteroidota bacterium]
NSIKVFGKEYQEPRLTEYYGPPYQYSSIAWPEQEIPNWLSPLKLQLCELSQFSFNSVLLNYYRDGQDSMGWHRDNEKEMDSSVIASLSFGAERIFKIRHRDSKKTINIPLKNGDVLIMRDLQEDHEHSIPKTKKVLDPRINLTFRRMIK